MRYITSWESDKDFHRLISNVHCTYNVMGNPVSSSCIDFQSNIIVSVSLYLILT